MRDTVHWLLAFLTAMLLIVGAVVLFDGDRSTPLPHPQFAAMEIGGPRAVDDAGRWGLGLAVGILMILALTACLMLAADNAPDAGSLRIVTIAGGAVFVSVFVAMMLAYRDYASQDHPLLWGPFPTPTTWMVFGLWLTPSVFIIIYFFGFNKWFVSTHDPRGDGTAGGTTD